MQQIRWDNIRSLAAEDLDFMRAPGFVVMNIRTKTKDLQVITDKNKLTICQLVFVCEFFSDGYDSISFLYTLQCS